MPYVDGFIIPLPKDKIEQYRTIATRCGELWREHGALEFRECVADDVQMGELTSFPRSILQQEHETVIFSWIVYASREQRDQTNAKVMADPRMKAMMDPDGMLFDGKRMIFGGFQMLVDM
ncbi:MAG TPA: DUF1428 domain-containing protein [Telluria sp.]|jgi:uncharacterized protein YbaA (DUF1428 family)